MEEMVQTVLRTHSYQRPDVSVKCPIMKDHFFLLFFFLRFFFDVVDFIIFLEKEMATHSSILAWKIPWTEEPGLGYS